MVNNDNNNTVNNKNNNNNNNDDDDDDDDMPLEDFSRVLNKSIKLLMSYYMGQEIIYSKPSSKKMQTRSYCVCTVKIRYQL